jgi:DNA-binding NtrC family response regulator
MKKNGRLVCWIGYTDLLSMAADADERTQKQVFEALEMKPKLLRKDTGPIRTLLENEAFEDVHFLCDKPAVISRKYVKWLGKKATVHTVDHLQDPTDYAAIFTVVDATLSALPASRASLNILLSPGTPAMTAIWVLLGKSRYPATFFQSYNGKSWQSEIPYDLISDYLPELLRDPDSNLARLAAQPPAEIKGFEKISGESKAIRLAVGRAAKAAVRDVNVLLLGDSGTGKERFARAIHSRSPRNGKGLFHAINCAAIPRELLESELFGHEKGAFTGASKQKDGWFRKCDGGTLFLDEIGECPLELQPKLLRVLQPPNDKPSTYREFERVGGEETLTSNVRIVAATNRDPIKEINSGTFREDLYYRLAVIEVQLPSILERKSDLEVLSNDLLGEINDELAQSEVEYTAKKLSPQTIKFIRQYDWPGNVRELRNALMQAAVMTDAESLSPADLKPGISSMRRRGASSILDRELGGSFQIDDVIDELRISYIERAMTEANGVKKHAAERLLGMENWQTMDNQMKKLGIDAERWKKK